MFKILEHLSYHICARLHTLINMHMQLSSGARVQLSSISLLPVCQQDSKAESRAMIWLQAPQWLQMLSGPKVIKLFFMLNSTEHRISTAHKNYNIDK